MADGLWQQSGGLWPVSVIQFTINYRSDVSDYVDLLRNVGNGEMAAVPVPDSCT
jgi:hypothetical protein